MGRALQDLKAALKELGLPVTGKKDDLVQRLFAAKSTDGSAEPAAEGDEAAAAETAVATEAAPVEAAATTDAGAAKEGDAEEAEAEAAAPAAAGKPSKHAPIVFNTVAAAATGSVSRSACDAMVLTG